MYRIVLSTVNNNTTVVEQVVIVPHEEVARIHALNMIRARQPNGIFAPFEMDGCVAKGEEKVLDHLKTHKQWSQMDGTSWYGDIEDNGVFNENGSVFTVQIVDSLHL